MKYKNKLLLTFIGVFFLFFPLFSQANGLADTDGDNVPDVDEIEIYKTDPEDPDTDGDGYSDWTELNNGYSPHSPEGVKLEDYDYDQDGLSDRMELNFHTDLSDADTDGDGVVDGEEVENGYDPRSSEKKRLEKRIEIDIAKQEMSYFLGGVRMGKFLISSGLPSMPTPKGHFEIINKHLKPWSSYGLWMPYWMGLGTGRFGIHELPVWPSGYREGEDHLGKAVSHGCIRLGVGAAEFMYNWAEVGTKVFIF